MHAWTGTSHDGRDYSTNNLPPGHNGDVGKRDCGAQGCSKSVVGAINRRVQVRKYNGTGTWWMQGTASETDENIERPVQALAKKQSA